MERKDVLTSCFFLVQKSLKRNQENVIAYISDAILLKEIIKEEQNINLNDYILLPKNGFLSYEYYGIVVYENSQSIVDYNDLYKNVNDWISPTSSTSSSDADSKKEWLYPNTENAFDKFWKQQIAKWYKGDLFSLWLMLGLLIFCPLIITYTIITFLINKFVKYIPEKIALWLYKVSQEKVILIFVDFENRTTIENKIINATIAEIPFSNNNKNEIEFKNILTKLNQSIIKDYTLDYERKQKALDDLREIVYKCKEKNIKEDNLITILSQLNEVSKKFNEGISGVDTFFLQLIDIKENISNLLGKN